MNQASDDELDDELLSANSEEFADDTGVAPSFRAPVAAPPIAAIIPINPIIPIVGEGDPRAAPTIPVAPVVRAVRDNKPLALLPGARIDDFEIVRMLGRGAFGIVYLARQVTLDRHVALKISANRGSEGRTMARLEHQHIVQVFSESVDVDFNQRLLCMQLVPGVSLDKLIAAIHAKWAGKRSEGSPPWTGRELLQTIDATPSLPSAFDPSALHDREAMSKMDAVEATAWYGARLAEALDFAHKHGVLHRDIKPANILVNPYGRPMLADFNISSQPEGSEPGEEIFGGTFAYMAPEHLDAFNPSDPTEPEAVDQRSDLYSLGLVLNQLLQGRLSFDMPPPGLPLADTLRQMADQRRAKCVTCQPGPPSARQTLERTIGRMLSPVPNDRFASGAEVAEQLNGCRSLETADKQLPPPRRGIDRVLRQPFLWLIVLVVLPQLIASVVNITYNMSQIVDHFEDDQKLLFGRLVFVYNAIIYPIALALFIYAVRPVWRCWQAMSRAEALAEGQVTAARQQALRLPRWIAMLAALGWYPGGVIFPLVIHEFAGPLAPNLAGHFLASFWLSGLIGMAYSLCGVQFVVLRALYPTMWHDVRSFGENAKRELEPVPFRLGVAQALAVSIPLVAVLFLVGLSDATDNRFRGLVCGLIVLGMFGSYLTNAVTRALSQVVEIFRNAK